MNRVSLQRVELYPAAPVEFQMQSFITNAPEAEKILSCLGFKDHTPNSLLQDY